MYSLTVYVARMLSSFKLFQVSAPGCTSDNLNRVRKLQAGHLERLEIYTAKILPELS